MGKFKIIYESTRDWINFERNLYLNKKIILSYLNSNKIKEIYTILDMIKKNKRYQPVVEEIQKAGTWEVELYNARIRYFSGTGPISSRSFESDLTLLSPGGDYPYNNIVIRSIKGSINDVYLHTINVNKLEGMIDKNIKKWESLK